MIVPYMSIDLFFVAAPFLCATRSELSLFSRRIVFTIVAAGLCFLLFPLELAVERPPASGWIRAIFNSFREVDLPHNLCPSLHIALRTVLADLYARHTKGLTRWISHGWFSLIGISTLLTYQHHLIDVAGGFVLACVCFYLVRDVPLRLPMVPNRRIGKLYVTAAVLTMTLAILVPVAAFPFAWCSLATGIVSLGHLCLGSAIFRKRDGILPLSTRLLLAPTILAQRWSHRHYSRQCVPWSEISDKVWLGRLLSTAEASKAIDAGVRAVVDLTVNFSETPAFRSLKYLPLETLDLTAPTNEQIDTAVEFIQREAENGVVYVHCKVGYSRSGVIVGCYLIAAKLVANANEAMATLRQHRPPIVIRPEAETAIREYERRITVSRVLN